MNVNELSGAQLDYFVARAVGRAAKIDDGNALIERVRMGVLDGSAEPLVVLWGKFSPSTNWTDGGPIIEREKIELAFWLGSWGGFISGCAYESADPDGWGDTPLVAAMRAYVKVKFGKEVYPCA
jgi:hypothetical protein